MSVTKAEGTIIYQNDPQTVYTGFHMGRTPENDPDFPAIDIVFEVTDRTDSTKLLWPDVEVQTFWTPSMNRRKLFLYCITNTALYQNISIAN